MPLVDPFEEKQPTGLVDPFAEDLPKKEKVTLAPKPTPPPSKGFWGSMADIGLGTVEAPLSLLSGLGAGIVGKVEGGIESARAGLMGEPDWGAKAQKVKQDAMQRLTYQPRSESGRQAANMAGTAINYTVGLPAMGGEWAGKKLEESGHPNLAYLTREAGEDISYLLPSLAKQATPAIKAGISKIAETVLPSAERLYGSAIKTPLSKRWIKNLPGEEISARTRAIQQGIQDRVLPGKQGLEQARALERSGQDMIDHVINEATKEGKKIKTDDILDAGLQSAYDAAANSSDPLAAKAIIDNFKEKFKVGHGEEVDLSKAQKIKKQLYKEANWSGNETTGLSSQLAQLNKKGVAHQYMSALEEEIPELKNLNYTDGARINLIEALEKYTSRYGNTNLVGLGAKILLAGKHPLMALADVLGIPSVKARLAFAIDRATKTGKGKTFNLGQDPNLPPLAPGPNSPWTPPGPSRPWFGPNEPGIAGLIEHQKGPQPWYGQGPVGPGTVPGSVTPKTTIPYRGTIAEKPTPIKGSERVERVRFVLRQKAKEQPPSPITPLYGGTPEASVVPQSKIPHSLRKWKEIGSE